jgi:hypothetical protein
LAATGCFTTSKPATRRTPALGFRIPAIARSVVVLPAPLGPTKPRIAPAGTAKERSSTAFSAPVRL